MTELQMGDPVRTTESSARVLIKKLRDDEKLLRQQGKFSLSKRIGAACLLLESLISEKH